MKMSSTIRLLSLVLVIQIGLFVFLQTQKSDLGAFQASETFLDLDRAAVNMIIVEDGDGEKITLQKSDDRWVLPEFHSFPAEEGKIEEILVNLPAAKRSWPVSTSEVAAKQLKLTEKEFERRIAYKNNDKELHTILLGSSPGYKKVHARIAGEDNGYSIAFTAHDAPTKQNLWYDKKLLSLEQSEIKRIELNEFALERGDNGFQLADIQEEEKVNSKQLNALLGRFENFLISEVLGTEEKEEYQMASPTFAYTVELSSGDRVNYTFAGAENEKNTVLKVSSLPFYFKVSPSVAQGIQQVTRDKLVSPEPAIQQPKFVEENSPMEEPSEGEQG